MKTFFKKFFVIIAILLASTTVTNLTAKHSAYADLITDGCNSNFFGLDAWYCGINDDWQGETNLTNNIWTIVANVSNDLLTIASYLVLGYVIYGGYLYMFASGDPSKTASGKKTLARAFIGLAIVMLSKVIVGALRIALFGSSGNFSQDCVSNNCITPNDMVTNLIQWTIGISGIVAAVFVVVGAIGYLTSAGDPNKLKKSKDTIMYALIGLAIVGLAEIITGFVTSTIRNANSYVNTTTIAKELK